MRKTNFSQRFYEYPSSVSFQVTFGLLITRLRYAKELKMRTCLRGYVTKMSNIVLQKNCMLFCQSPNSQTGTGSMAPSAIWRLRSQSRCAWTKSSS